ncbi:hypothetical protein [Lentzea terrae]|uniref:hypothetical protein n=1 Tax=Lentzea terrae TaxID=2200761 RepID=UPI0013007F0A|nr:hypothetical protein [Lentzea terrae]
MTKKFSISAWSRESPTEPINGRIPLSAKRCVKADRGVDQAFAAVVDQLSVADLTGPNALFQRVDGMRLPW